MPVGSRNIPKRKKEYVEALARHGTHMAAVAATGINRSAAWKWRTEDPEFEKACNEAQGKAIDELVDSAYIRAMNVDGKYDERTAAILAMFLIKGHRPTYKDSYKAEIDVGTIKFTFQIPKPEGLTNLPSLPEHDDVIDGEVLNGSREDL